MLSEDAVFDAHDVNCDPVGRMAEITESAMHHDPVTLGQNQAVLIPKGWWSISDEIEEPIAPGLDVGAVLDIVWRPEGLGCRVIALVGERMKCLQN